MGLSEIGKHLYITVMSLWARWRLKSSATLLFAQPFIQAQIKENTRAPHHSPLWWEPTGHWWISLTTGRERGKCFHLMTSSWSTTKQNSAWPCAYFFGCSVFRYNPPILAVFVNPICFVTNSSCNTHGDCAFTHSAYNAEQYIFRWYFFKVW